MAYSSIVKPTDYFRTKLYTGNGGSQSITFDETATNMQPDWIWIKKRNGAADSSLMDVVRGVRKSLSSNSTIADYTESSGLSAFDTNGFSFDGAGYNHVNTNSDTFAAWTWKAGGSASSNGDGSITSSVSVNTTAGFSIVSYAGNSTAGATVGHGLGSAPTWILGKNRTDTDTWFMYHGSLGGGFSMGLNNTNAKDTNTGFWNNTAPSSTVFTLGNNTDANETGKNFIAYCFAEKKGHSKFGSYTGNGNSDGAFAYTGFKPAFVIIKSSSASSTNWNMYDNKRDGFNGSNENLSANLADAESSGNNRIDILSNGFKVRASTADVGTSSATYIYMAFAENPFVANDSGTAVPVTAR